MQANKRSDFAAMVQAMRVYVTVDGNSSCPTDFLPIGISHYRTMNTVSSLVLCNLSLCPQSIIDAVCPLQVFWCSCKNMNDENRQLYDGSADLVLLCCRLGSGHIQWHLAVEFFRVTVRAWVWS